MREAYINELKHALDAVTEADFDGLKDALMHSYTKDAQVFIIGNGGSAATASHFCCDLAKGAAVEGKKRFKAMSLTDNMALIGAIGNDISFDDIFAEQLRNLLQKDDLVIAISASGNSPNVVKAVKLAKSTGARTFALAGFGGGRIAEICDRSIVVKSNNYGVVEDLHLIIEHIITQELRSRIEG